MQQGLPVAWGQWTAQPGGFQHRWPLGVPGMQAPPPGLLCGRPHPPGFYEATNCRGTCSQSEGWYGRSAWRAVAAPCLQHHEVWKHYQSTSKAHATVLLNLRVCRPLLCVCMVMPPNQASHFRLLREIPALTCILMQDHSQASCI